MMIKASGRSALILATGLFVCLAGPSQVSAATDSAAVTAKSVNLKSAKSERHGRHLKRFAHRKHGKVALKSAPARKPADTADDDAGDLSALPSSVANANAQLASADVPAGNAKAMTARANTIVQAASDNPASAQPAADGQVVAPDQLNDVDRTLRENSPSKTTVAMASSDRPAAPLMSRSDDNSTWDQTSLIGKIFIAFGALLTMASAARMFMA